MTAFLRFEKERYLVRDSRCLGMKCLDLGDGILKAHKLSFRQSQQVKCCTTYLSRGCPINAEFSILIRAENIKKGMSIRLI